MEPKSWL